MPEVWNMEAWSWSFTLYPCAFPSLWRFAFDCKLWRIITAAVKTPSQAPQLRITILLSVHSSSVPPPKAVLSSSRCRPPATLISLPKYTVPLWDSGPVSVSSLKHTYTLNFFFQSLKSIESLRKYWQLEATTGWSDSRKPLIMITSSYFSPFPLFCFPLFPLSCAWSTSTLTWSWFINQHVHVIPATEESSGPLHNIIPISHATKYTPLLSFLLYGICLHWQPTFRIDEAWRSRRLFLIVNVLGMFITGYICKGHASLH